MNPINRAEKLYKPEPGMAFGEKNALYTIDQQFQIRLVGIIALFLPIGAIVLTATGLACDYDSLSHYYFSPGFGPLFVGSMMAIALFMCSYRGESWAEKTFTPIGGIAAFMVGWIPTSGSGCNKSEFGSRLFGDIGKTSDSGVTISPFEGHGHFMLFPSAGFLHAAAATILLVFLTWYTLVVFRRPISSFEEQTPTDGDILAKNRRNMIYAISGAVMIASLIGIVLGNFGMIDRIFGRNYMFVFECTALIAFGVSWSVKGRLFGLLMDSRDIAARQRARELSTNAER